MSEKNEPPDLIWFLAALFAIGALFTGGVMIYALLNADVRSEGGISLWIPLVALVVLGIRGVGFWQLVKLRKSAPNWLLAALLVSATFSFIHVAAVGHERFLHQHGSFSLIVGYIFATVVVGYAFSLRREGILKD